MCNMAQVSNMLSETFVRFYEITLPLWAEILVLVLAAIGIALLLWIFLRGRR